MWEIIKNLVSPSQFIPHGHCYLWKTPLVLLHLVSDLLIALAYFSIPAMLIYFVCKRKDVPFMKVFVLFGAFIILCGAGHLLEIWTLWHPAYWLTGIEQACTALVSCYTALQMVNLLPQFLALRTPEQLEAINLELQREVMERQKAELALRSAYDELEIRVQERTTKLLETNAVLETEIQERIAAELALQQQSAAMAAVSDGIAILNGEKKYVYVNDAYRQLFGYESEAELLGKSWQILYEPSEIERFEREIIPEFQRRGTCHLEATGKRRDGSTFLQEITVTQLEGGASVCVIRDIRERKRAESTLREMAERERAIAKVIQRMRQTLEIKEIFSATTQELRQAISCDRVLVYQFYADWSGEIVAESVAPGWNLLVEQQMRDSELKKVAVDQVNCAVKTLDMGEQQICDTYLQENQGGIYRDATNYRCVSDIYAAGFDDCYLELLEKLQAKAYIIVPIFRGSQLWGLLATYQNSALRLWQEAEIKMVVQIGSQLGVALQQAELLTQTQRQSIELMKAKEAADAANRAKSEFLANMSHELRTPLNAILGFTQVLNRDTSLKAEHQQSIEIISRSGEHLLELINDILEMSKIEAGRVTLNENDFDLYCLLDNLSEMFKLRATSKQIQLSFQPSPQVPQYIKSDESKLRQVLINLLGNAIKFTASGSVTLRVDLTNSYSGEIYEERLLFEVTDTGAGIAPEDFDKLFTAFGQTTSGLKSGTGTGLGLSISQKFVQLMGGKITVDSQLGLGSKFSFEIPANVVESSQVQKPQIEKKRIIGLAPNQPNYRILVVEDKFTNRLLLVNILTSLGFEVREAEDGEKALALWETWAPQLIWMDMRMPVMNGYEATKRIKEHPNGQQTKIIALTASAFEEDRQLILSLGCDDFLRKPFREEELLGKMSKYLGVKYIYEELIDKDETEKTSDKLSDNVDHLPRESMSQEWVEELYYAAAQGNDSLVYQLIEQIPQNNAPMIRNLTNLTEKFQFEEIMKLAETGLSEKDEFTSLQG